jgi:hypothetical protein
LRLGEELGHEGGALNRVVADLVCGPGAPRGGHPFQTRGRVRAGLTPEVGDDPNGRAPPVSERRRKRGGSRPRGGAGPGRSWAARGGKEKGKKEASGLLGRAMEGKRLAGLSRAGREREGKVGLGQAASGKREREKRKERVGRAQLDKEGEKQLHLNAYEFEFEI